MHYPVRLDARRGSTIELSPELTGRAFYHLKTGSGRQRTAEKDENPHALPSFFGSSLFSVGKAGREEES
ncbi:MAG: hypothetical protein KY468_08350, partial [Armatimonadetes bacterium]|nr:hypothetical protein [Armatimonadota bacterium]